MKIELTRGFFATVDEDNFERLNAMRWYAHGTTRIYARGIPHGFLHHHVLPKKEGFVVDHIDGNSLNNTRWNLRYLTQSQNKFNSGAYQRDGQTSQYRGVHKRKSGWMARITINQRTRSLGTFKTEIEAHLAYEAARSLIVEVHAYA